MPGLPAMSNPKDVAAARANTTKSPAKLDGWLFKQKKIDTGEQEIIVTENAIRITNLTHGFKAICKAPDWKVSFFRPGVAKLWQADLSEFSGNMIFAPMTSPKRKTGIGEKVGSTTMDGLKCDLYTSGNSVITAPVAVKLSQQGSEFICRYYDLPKIDYFPLNWHLAKLHQKKEKPSEIPWLDRKNWESFSDVGTVRLKTVNWSKKQFDDSDFAVPEHHTLTKDIHDITYSDKSRGEMTELLEDLGFSQSEKALDQKQLNRKPQSPK